MKKTAIPVGMQNVVSRFSETVLPSSECGVKTGNATVRLGGQVQPCVSGLKTWHTVLASFCTNAVIDLEVPLEGGDVHKPTTISPRRHCSCSAERPEKRESEGASPKPASRSVTLTAYVWRGQTQEDVPG